MMRSALEGEVVDPTIFAQALTKLKEQISERNIQQLGTPTIGQAIPDQSTTGTGI